MEKWTLIQCHVRESYLVLTVKQDYVILSTTHAKELKILFTPRVSILLPRIWYNYIYDTATCVNWALQVRELLTISDSNSHCMYNFVVVIKRLRVLKYIHQLRNFPPNIVLLTIQNLSVSLASWPTWYNRLWVVCCSFQLYCFDKVLEYLLQADVQWISVDMVCLFFCHHVQVNRVG